MTSTAGRAGSRNNDSLNVDPHGSPAGPPPPDAGLRTPSGYAGVLRHRRYLLWQSGATAAAAGYAVYAVSVPWAAYRATGSFLTVGLVLLAEVGVYALTFLLAPLVDRASNKRTLYLACYPAMAAAAAALAVGLQDGRLSVPELLAGVVAISLLWDIVWATNNVVPRLLLGADGLFPAGGLGSLFGGVTQLGGFAGGAALVAYVSPAGGLYLYSGLLSLSAAISSVVSLPMKSASASRPYLEGCREGWRMFATPGGALRQLAAVEFARGLVTPAYTLFIVLLTSHEFASSGAAYGAIYVAWVTGGIAIGLLLGQLRPRHSVGKWLGGSCLLAAALVAIAALTPTLLSVDLAIWATVGAAVAAYTTSESVYLQGSWPEAALGRITANLYVFTGTAGAAGALLFGALAGTADLRSFGLLATVPLLVAGALVVSSRRLRSLAF